MQTDFFNISFVKEWLMATPWQQFCWKNKGGQRKTQPTEARKTIEQGAKLQQRPTENAPKGDTRNSRNANQRAPSKKKQATEERNKEETQKKTPEAPGRTKIEQKTEKKIFAGGAPQWQFEEKLEQSGDFCLGCEWIQEFVYIVFPICHILD